MPHLSLRRVQKTFATAMPVHALNGVDLSVPPGQFLSIVGPSGSSKSTLLSLIALLDRPSDGSYYIAGEPVPEEEKARSVIRSHLFGFVFQSFHLIEERTLVDNVALGLRYQNCSSEAILRRANKCLEEVGLFGRAQSRVSELSGGEKQRVAIARAIVADAPVIVADEPTGNLDSTNSRAIMQIFKRLNEDGRTVIVVTHDPEVAAYASRKITVSDGKIIQDTAATLPVAKADLNTTPIKTKDQPPKRRHQIRSSIIDAATGLISRKKIPYVYWQLLGLGSVLR